MVQRPNYPNAPTGTLLVLRTALTVKTQGYAALCVRNTVSVLCIREDFLTFAAPPGPMQDFSVTPHHSSMNIGWLPPPPLTHSAPITQYIITCSTYGLPLISERTTGTSIVLTGLRPETWYHCCVAADSLSGSGERYCQRTRTSQER